MALIKLYHHQQEVKNISVSTRYEVYAHYGIPDKNVTHNI